MENTKRAVRRHHRARLLERTIDRLSISWKHVDDLTLFAAKRYNNMKNCSCHMCCNERRNPWYCGEERLTLQERKAKDDYNDQMKEYYDSE